VFNILIMEIDIKVNILRGNFLEKVDMTGKMTLFMKDSGKTTSDMVEDAGDLQRVEVKCILDNI